jgi:methyl-accepting chemotaxis protein
MSEQDQYRNFTTAISRFIVGYNKGMVLNTITSDSMNIITNNLSFIKNSLETVVAAFEEIQATSSSATQNSTKISKMMEEVEEKNTSMTRGITEQVEEIRKASEDAHQINNTFNDFAEKSKDVLNVTDEIQDISERTNILAINASIEAARAGEVGKGFRIIANEIRNLAGLTGTFADDIGKTISEFGETIKTLTTQMDSFLTLLGNISEHFEGIQETFQDDNRMINETSSNLSMISDAIREQNEALTDGLKSLEAVFSSSRDTEAVVNSLLRSHGSLDSLLDREQ